LDEARATSGIDRYFQSMQNLHSRVIARQQVPLSRVAAQLRRRRLPSKVVDARAALAEKGWHYQGPREEVMPIRRMSVQFYRIKFRST
jgi:hypothetical protein